MFLWLFPLFNCKFQTLCFYDYFLYWINKFQTLCFYDYFLYLINKFHTLFNYLSTDVITTFINWLSLCNKNFPSISCREELTFGWDDDDVCFKLDQHDKFDSHWNNTICSYTDMSFLSGTLSWFPINQTLPLIPIYCMLIVEKQHIPIL